MNNELIFENESYAIRGAIYEVYKTLGSGYLEEVYQNALEEEFSLRQIPFLAKKSLHIFYKGRDCGVYQPDFMCFGQVIVEIKAVDALHERHSSQLMNYLKATGFRLGFLVNFCSFPKIEIRRMVL